MSQWVNRFEWLSLSDSGNKIMVSTQSIQIPSGKTPPPLQSVIPEPANMCEWIKALAYSVAPDLRNSGVYIAADSELCGNATGLSSPTLHLVIRECSRERANGRAIDRHFPSIFPRSLPMRLRTVWENLACKIFVLATSLHEIAHVLDRLSPDGAGLVGRSQMRPADLRRHRGTHEQWSRSKRWSRPGMQFSRAYRLVDSRRPSLTIPHKTSRRREGTLGTAGRLRVLRPCTSDSLQEGPGQ